MEIMLVLRIALQKFQPQGAEAFHESDFSFWAFGGEFSERANFGNWLISLAKHHRRSTFHKTRVMGKTLFCLGQIGRDHVYLTYSRSKKVNFTKNAAHVYGHFFGGKISRICL
ncbi:MAG: hypothetical protein KGR46_04960 [Verrucomicrobia bacterium]|nr:hypothetical protein [Verrucomicrobiota bacterium]